MKRIYTVLLNKTQYTLVKNKCYFPKLYSRVEKINIFFPTVFKNFLEIT